MKTETVDISTLTLDPANTRKHGQRNLDTLKASLVKFGLQKPIVVDAKGLVVAGNGTVEAARALGWTEIAVVRTGLEGPDRAAYSIVDNRSSELGEWDNDLLGAGLSTLKELDFDLDALGFTDDDLAQITGHLKEGLTDPDDVPQPVEPITQPGDLWVLGEHRLLCGDSSKTEDINRLCSETSVDLVLTDPPYGINIVRGLSAANGAKPFGRVRQPGGHPSGVLKGKVGGPGVVKPRLYAPVTGDDKPFDPTALLTIGTHQIIFGGIYFSRKLTEGTTWLCWDKGVSDAATFSGFELAWTSFKGRHRMYRHTWSGMVRQGSRDVELKDRVHPTQKPVGLFAAILADFAPDGSVVCDPFLGSGTTLIACEQLGRRCFALEIEPRYCDTTVRRWETFTGKKAERQPQEIAVA